MKDFWLSVGFPRKKPAEEETGPRYADVYERALAGGIDIWLLFLLFHNVFFWLQQRIYARADRDMLIEANQTPGVEEKFALLWQAQLPQLWAFNMAVQVLILGAIIVAIQSIWGATPGKWLMGLEIRRAGTLEQPARWRLALRFLGYTVSALPLMLGFFWMSFNKQRRGWHDFIAGTVVIHTRPKGWLWSQTKRLWSLLMKHTVGKKPAEQREDNRE